MILRDPVHGLVDFEGPDEKTVEALLATREVQRLRRIRQLGLTSLVFPGAEHSRFSHAVGAARVMVRLLDRLALVQSNLPVDQRIDASARQDAIAAALLHDLGHGPFSHLFEQVLPEARHHEEWTTDAILNDAGDIYRALESLSVGMAERVAGLLVGRHRLSYLPRTVSGAWDVDRADYLLRDSHMTGVRYGLYDLDWLLRAFTLAERTVPATAGGEPTTEWVLAIEGRKGLPPIESFFLGRHYMYQQVYHHKATRAAETLIRGIFARLAERVQEGRTPAQTPIALKAAACGEKVPLGAYLALDDAAVLSAMAAWAKGEDRLLAELCDDLLARRLPKTLPLPEEDEAVWHRCAQRAQEITERAGLRADLLVHLDVAADTPYAEPEDKPCLYVQIRHRSLQRLGDVSFLLQQLRGKRIRRPRLIFPAKMRAEVQAAATEILDTDPAR